MQEFTLDPEQMVVASAATHFAKKMWAQGEKTGVTPYTPEITFLAGPLGKQYRMHVNEDMTVTLSEVKL